jgi:hypothetical protein
MNTPSIESPASGMIYVLKRPEVIRFEDELETRFDVRAYREPRTDEALAHPGLDRILIAYAVAKSVMLTGELEERRISSFSCMPVNPDIPELLDRSSFVTGQTSDKRRENRLMRKANRNIMSWLLLSREAHPERFVDA